MSNIAQIKQDYARTASAYEADLPDSPLGLLESQLLELAIGDASGLLVLDIGGGTGIYARQAIAAGATRVDLVDVSPDMISVGRNAEIALGREDKLRFYEADASKPLDHLPLEKYDIVMANWVFDHADTIEMLEGMWQNVASYLKPGGKFLGIRICDVSSPALRNDKYGVRIKDVVPIPGGARYTVVDPSFEVEATTLDASASLPPTIYEKLGLTNLEVIPYEKTKTVAENPDLWQEFLQQPYCVVVQAIKASE
ncbi:Malonyl-[acyl-carrier protein] O-methyltransferase [Paramyrothecium foliicola]|nr:Malonyl-[acyl-carrier protein] O-methyltransferase [Paramyrothecium foliicola]